MSKIVLDLTLDETNIVLAALADQPFKVVAQLVVKIQQQAQPQAEQAAGTAATQVGPLSEVQE